MAIYRVKATRPASRHNYLSPIFSVRMAAASVRVRQAQQVTSVDRHDEFMRLFVQVQPRLHSYVRSMVPNRCDAEDVMQETGVVLWNKFDEFELGTNFAHWAVRVARLQVLSFYKRNQKNVLRFGHSFIELMADKAAVLVDDTSHYLEALEECLAKLSDKDRDLIRLRYETAACTTREVAKVQGRPDTTIYNSLARIRRMLMRCVQRSLGPG